MHKRRQLLIVLAALPLGALAQPKKIPVIGYLAPVVPPDSRLDAFRRGMRELGYIEGQDYRLEIRWGEGRLERMPALAAELVKLKPDVIIGANSPAYLALKDATRPPLSPSPRLAEIAYEGRASPTEAIIAFVERADAPEMQPPQGTSAPSPRRRAEVPRRRR